MTGHVLVRFSARERQGLQRFVDQGGLLFSDDCNHDVAGLYAVSFEREMRTIFPGPGTLAKLPGAHPLYSSFFAFPTGRRRPRTSSTAGATTWSTTTCAASSTAAASGCVYSNKDYGCEWDYDWRNKRFRREDNTTFAVNLAVYAFTA